MDTRQKPTPSRRNFLLAAGVGGVAAAAAAITGGSLPPHASVKDKRRSQGYRLTEHVRSYYRTTQI